MKKLLFALMAVGLTLLACQKDNSELNQTNIENFKGHAGVTQRSCDSHNKYLKDIKKNPGYAKKQEQIAKHTAKFIASKKPTKPGGGNGGGNGGNGGGGTDPIDDGLGTISIPVVVHVIYSNENENISDAQIQSQIDILNADFAGTNGDAGLVPAEFADNFAQVDIQFSLIETKRISSSRQAWGTNDDMKFDANGGSNVVSPATHLNIWVCNIGGGILGYAQFPGGSASTDGVVVAPQYFGNTGFVSAPFDKGRTATHEVGHYLNLRHIWGDGRCKRDDGVADTPSSDGPNYGCPNYPTVNCRSTDMTMNYMDYVNDECMYMFSEGQKQRMRPLFAPGGARSGMMN